MKFGIGEFEEKT